MGADFDAIDNSVEAPGIGRSDGGIKARYRGQDLSELDPDYVRAPVYTIPYFPGTSHMNPSQTIEQYPSLNEAYRPPVPPRTP